MELPADVLQIIHEYSKPVTHPNWRNRQWICVGDLYKDILRKGNTNFENYMLYKKFIHHVQNNIRWDELYYFTRKYGIDETSKFYNIKPKICRDILTLGER
jgi:hypothetical protein